MATNAATPSMMDDMKSNSFDLFFLLSLMAILHKNLNLFIGLVCGVLDNIFYISDYMARLQLYRSARFGS